MNKGIIVEVNKRHLIVLAEGGEFKKIKKTNPAYAVGQEIRLPLAQENKRSIFSVLINWKTGIAVAIAIFLLFFQVLSPLSGPGAYAYVGMDMDPSLELKIDENLKVLDIFAFNQQGHSVLEHMEEWENKDIAYVTNLIFDTCEELGYLKTKEEVLITTTLSEKIPSDMEKEMKHRVNEVITETAKKKSVEMTTIVMSSKEREQSKKMKMSPGHYAIYKAAKRSGIKITKNEISGQTIEEISQKIGPIKELFSEENEKEKVSSDVGSDLVYEPPLPILDQKEDEEKAASEKSGVPALDKVEARKKRIPSSTTSHSVNPVSPQKNENTAESAIKETQKPKLPSVSEGEKENAAPNPPVKEVPVTAGPSNEDKVKDEKPKEEKPKEEKPKEEKPKDENTEEPVVDPEAEENWIYIEIIVDGIIIKVKIKTDSRNVHEELKKQALVPINQNSLIRHQDPTFTSGKSDEEIVSERDPEYETEKPVTAPDGQMIQQAS